MEPGELEYGQNDIYRNNELEDMTVYKEEGIKVPNDT